jgi:hypothetical protein
VNAQPAVAGDSRETYGLSPATAGWTMSEPIEPGVALRSTPGFTLSPATAGWELAIHRGSLSCGSLPTLTCVELLTSLAAG